MSRQKKMQLRRRCQAIRENMSPAKVTAGSRAVGEYLSHWPIFQRAETVLSFVAFRNEIDLSRLFERWPDKHWSLPRIVTPADAKPHLTLHLYDPARLVRHKFGMLEPEANLPGVDPGQVDVVLVPGVAFDRRGGRLGFGGGFYDGLLPLMSQAVSVGVTYDELVLDAVPMEPWDCPVTWLVTPSGMLETGGESLENDDI